MEMCGLDNKQTSKQRYRLLIRARMILKTFFFLTDFRIQSKKSQYYRGITTLFFREKCKDPKRTNRVYRHPVI